MRVSSTLKKRRNYMQKSLTIFGSLFENRTSPSVFEPSPRVKRDARGEERLVSQHAEAFPSFAVQLLDLAELRFVRGMWTPVRPAQPEGRCERDVAEP